MTEIGLCNGWIFGLLIGILTHLKLCLADAIQNFKWVKIPTVDSVKWRWANKMK